MAKKVTPVYSAFAMVAIESVWPSTRGDEVPVNFRDLTLLNERIGEQSEKSFFGEELDNKKNEFEDKKIEFDENTGPLAFKNVSVINNTRKSLTGEFSPEQLLQKQAIEVLANLKSDTSTLDERFVFEDGTGITVNNLESLKAFEFKKPPETNVKKEGNYDPRYYSISTGTREVLDNLFSSLTERNSSVPPNLPEATRVRVTEIVGTYRSAGEHRGFDIVLDPAGVSTKNGIGGVNLQPIFAPFRGKIVFSGIRSSDNDPANNYGFSVALAPVDGNNNVIGNSALSLNHLASEGRPPLNLIVDKGALIGYQSDSGISFGAHIHVEVVTGYSATVNTFTGSRIQNIEQFANIAGSFLQGFASTPSGFAEIYRESGKGPDSDRDYIMSLVYKAVRENSDIPEPESGTETIRIITFRANDVVINGSKYSQAVFYRNLLLSLKESFDSGSYTRESLQAFYNYSDINFFPYKSLIDIDDDSTGNDSRKISFLSNWTFFYNFIQDSIRLLDLFISNNKELFDSLSELESEIASLESSRFGSGYALYPQSDVRPSFSSLLTKKDGYKKRKGYFKIIPLNILQVSSSTGTSGAVGSSKFDISFTLDDVIIIADEYGKGGIFDTISSTALPMSIDSVFDEVYRVFGGEIPEALKQEIVPYGFSAYRISGNNFTFNIEDIVEANDTVSIWLYHDPKEFDFIEENYGEEQFLQKRDVAKEIKEAEGVIDEINSVKTEYRLFPRYNIVEESVSLDDTESDVVIFNVFRTDRAIEKDENFIQNANNLLLSNEETLTKLNNLLSTLNNLKDAIDAGNEFDVGTRLIDVDIINYNSNMGRILGDKTNSLSFCSAKSLENSRQIAEITKRYSLYVQTLSLCRGSTRISSSSPNRDLLKSIELLNNIIRDLSAELFISRNILNDIENGEEEEEKPIGLGDILEDEVNPESETTSVLNPREYNSILNKRTFSYVIGSGSRRSQDDFKFLPEDEQVYSSRGSVIDSILFDSGVLSEYLNPETIQKLIDGDEEIKLSPTEVFNIILAMGNKVDLSGFESGTFGRPTDENIKYLNYLSSIIFPNDSNPLMRSQFSKIVTEIFIVDVDDFNNRIKAAADNTGNFTVEDEELRKFIANLKIEENPQIYRGFFNEFSSSILKTLEENTNKTAEEQAASWNASRPTYIDSENNSYPLSLIYPDKTVKEIFEFIKIFTPYAENIVYDAVEFISGDKPTLIVTPGKSDSGFFNKRKMFITRSHGETPYLVLKGHIENVEASYGASSGSHKVRISGSGYEKILNDNLVYFDDLYLPRGDLLSRYVDANTLYSNMLPPVAMLSFIETHVPRFLIVGKKSATEKNTFDYGLRFYRIITDAISEESRPPGLNQDELPNVTNPVALSFLPDEDSSFVRGRIQFKYNSLESEGSNSTNVRVYYPINYLNTSRIAEMISVIERTSSAKDGVIQIPVTITSNQSVAQNLINLSGPKEIHDLFVDESGRLKQRLSFEAWERTPRPEFMPTITDNDILAAGATFSRNSSNLHTMVDIVPSFLANTGAGVASARFNGRTFSRGNDYIPILSSGVIDYLTVDNTLYDNFYEYISESFFRYGLRYKKFSDHYSPSESLAERKSILYHQFFHKPVKTAKITIKGNPSYRAGETVLTFLDSYRYRSREIIDLTKTINWLEYIKESPELTKMYIGVDERWLNEDSYYLTSALSTLPEYSYWLEKYKENPHKFVIEKMLSTLIYLKNTLNSPTSEPGQEENNESNLGEIPLFITPDYFPTTLWAFEEDSSSVYPSLSNQEVRDAYGSIYDVLKGSKEKVSDLFSSNPNVINAIRMQNFRATSYYIESVQHSFIHGENFNTTLSLNHGQDNLVLVEPYTMRPIGFISVEKKMRIGYDDVVINEEGNAVFANPNKNTMDRLLWENFDEKRLSYLQKVYVEQFKLDASFKENTSFLYKAQKYRNSSNFLYDLSMSLGITVDI